MKFNIKNSYQQLAYDYSQKKRKRQSQKMLLFSKLAKKGQKILDLGCGDGRFYSYLPKGCHYLGLDFSSNLLSIAKKEHPQVQFILGDMRQAKTWKNLKKFDLIFCFASFHHLLQKKEQIKVLKFCHQALKKRGILVITVWNLWQFKVFKQRLKNFFKKKVNIPYKLSDGKKAFKSVDRWFYAFTPWELKKLSQSSGFKIKKFLFLKGKTLFDSKEMALVLEKKIS